jgi:ribonuclease P/MRP protein subunit RPP1
LQGCGVDALKRVFADLHLRLNVKNAAGTLRVLSKAAELGYGLVGVSLAAETSADEVERLRGVCGEVGLDFVSRVDLRPRGQDELMRQLRRLRRKFEVVCVSCESKAVARQAAKDRRVDLLSFPLLDFRRRFFDRAEAALARGGLAGLEVDVKPLLVLEGPARVRLLSWLRREVSVAEKFGVSVVVSSGVSLELLLRKPREMAALGFLFGLDEVSGLDAVSRVPVGLVDRNRGKLDSGFVAPGVRVVREGRDC